MAAIAIALSLIPIAPATAVPASVPSVNYNIGDGNERDSWTYGEFAPSPRSLIISANTRRLLLTMPFPQFDILSCSMGDESGRGVASSETYINHELEGPAVATLDIPANLIVAGSGAHYFIECRDGYADLFIARFVLTEGLGAGIQASYPGNDVKLVAIATAKFFGPDVFLSYGTSGSGQTVVPGNRVRLYGPAGSFSIEGRTNKSAVTITSGLTVVNGLDISVKPDGSILGFTIPEGLDAGRVDFAVRTVASRAGTPTTVKLDSVTRWADHAIYDPNIDGRSLTLSPFPSITGKVRVPNTLTAETGVWQPAPVTLSLRWLRDGVVIPGATKATYRTTAADFGRRVSVEVVGTKSGFRPVTRTSQPLPIG